MRDENRAPVSRRSDPLPDPRRGHPFATFREEMDRLFDNFLPQMHLGRGLADFSFNPALDLTENDKEVKLRAELPGVAEKDVEVRLDADLLTIRGEKREERTENGDQKRVVERSYGAFERSVRLPFTPDEAGVSADFKDGVLTVTAKKPADLAQATRRIPISKH